MDTFFHVERKHVNCLRRTEVVRKVVPLINGKSN